MTVSRSARRAVAGLVLTAAVTGCTLPGKDKPAPPAPPPDLNRPPAAVATRAGPFDAGPVRPPDRGALFGAWIKPDEMTQPGRIEAVGSWERTLGRRLDVLNTYRRFEQPVGTESDRVFIERGQTMMVSWASGDTRSITSGRHDALIRAQARRIRAAKVPMLLRFRWEMDRPNLRATMWSGADYVAAWRHARGIFDAEKVRNVSWVWCPTAEGFIRGDAPEFYPGDDMVDWTCVDVYAGHNYLPIGELMGPFLTWAARRPKPIIIGEFGVARAWGSARRARWLRDAVRTFKVNRQIKAVVYFESDPQGNGPKQQFRLSDDPTAFDAFTKLTADPYFRPAA